MGKNIQSSVGNKQEEFSVHGNTKKTDHDKEAIRKNSIRLGIDQEDLTMTRRQSGRIQSAWELTGKILAKQGSNQEG